MPTICSYCHTKIEKVEKYCHNCGRFIEIDKKPRSNTNRTLVVAEEISGSVTINTNPQQLIVECPICHRNEYIVNTFRCYRCQKINICNRHQDEATYLCVDCRRQTLLQESVPDDIRSPHSSNQVDLAVMVETVCDLPGSRKRTELASKILDGLRKNSLHNMNLRVSLIAFGDDDHIGGLEPHPRSEPLKFFDFKTVEEVTYHIRRLEPSIAISQDFEVASELALDKIAGLNWRLRAKKVLLSFVQYPPHPKRGNKAYSRQIASPWDLDWQKSLKHLRYSLKVQSIAVIDPISFADNLSYPGQLRTYTETYWKELGYSFYQLGFNHEARAIVDFLTGQNNQ